MRHDSDDEPYVIIERRSGSVGSFLLGIAVGAGIALLMAPQSGQETRRRIRTSARRVGDSAVGLAQDVTGTVADSFADARRRVDERIDSARQAIEVKRQQVARAMEAGRAAANQARDELERRLAETKAAYQAGAEVARSRPVRDARGPRGTRVSTTAVGVGIGGVNDVAGTAPTVATASESRPLGEVGPTGTDETNVEL